MQEEPGKGEPVDRANPPGAVMNVVAFVVLALAVGTALTMSTDLPGWATAAVAFGVARTVELAGLWWYGRS